MAVAEKLKGNTGSGPSLHICEDAPVMIAAIVVSKGALRPCDDESRKDI